MPHISTKVYGLVRRDHQILVERIHDTEGKLIRYRPLGGGLNFSETSEAGIRREFQEELGTNINILSLFCVAEEIYNYRGKPGHQIAFIYEIELLNKGLYQLDHIERTDMDATVEPEQRIMIKAEWIDPQQIPLGVTLVPADLAARLRQT